MTWKAYGTLSGRKCRKCNRNDELSGGRVPTRVAHFELEVKIMENRRINLDEQETTINYYPTRYDCWADFYSSSPSEIRRFKKYAEMNPEHVRIEKEDSVGIFGKVHSSWVVGIRPPRRVNMTEEQRQAARDRLAAGRTGKKSEA